MSAPLSVNAAYEALGRFVVRYRWLIVVFWLAVVVVTSATMPTLGSEVNDNNSAFLSKSQPSAKAANLATPLLGSGANGRISRVTVVAYRTGPLSIADLTAVQRERALVEHVPRVVSAQIAGVAAGLKAAVITVRVRLSPNDITKDKAIIDSIKRTFAHARLPASMHMHVAGQIATIVANQASSNRAGNKVQDFSLLFIIVLLLLVFRSLPAALVTLLPSGLALLIATRLIGALGAGGLMISSITQVLLIVLMLGAGTDYGLFLVFRVREELRGGCEPHEAVERAVVRVGESITGSAGTVMLALLTLLLAGFGVYHDLGVPLAVGVAVMLLIGLTLLPALLAILGRKAFWPSKIEPGTQREGVWGTVASRLVRHPQLTLGIGVLVFLALAAGALGYKSSGFGGATKAPKGSDAAAGNAALSKYFPQTSNNPANLILAYPTPVWQNPTRLVQAEIGLSSSGAFKQLSGPLDPNGTPMLAGTYASLHAKLGRADKLSVIEPRKVHVAASDYNAYRATASYVSSDGKIVQFEATLAAGSQSSTAAMNATPHVRSVLATAAKDSGASNYGVAGEAAAVYDINKQANHDLAVVIPVAIVAIGILLALVLRSLVAPLYLIVSVALSYLASLGVATLVFINIGGDSGISFILPFLMFVFLLALGEDYNILVMTRIREEAHNLPLSEAVVRAIARTGSTVTSAGIILGGTFAVFAIVGGGGSGGSQLRAIGFGLAFGILMDTFLVRTLLVPSMVMLLGRVNWWPSRLSREEDGRQRTASGVALATSTEVER